MKKKKRPSVLILASTDLYKDPRVYRQVIALQNDFDLITVSNLTSRHSSFRKTIRHILINPNHQTYESEKTTVARDDQHQQRLRDRIISLRNSQNIAGRCIFAVMRFVYRIARAARVRWILMRPERFKKDYCSHALPARLKVILQQTPVDVILVNEIDCLPSAVEFGRAKKIIYDAHEFSMGEAEESITWRLVNQPVVRYLCDTYIPQVDHMITVCEGILDEYKRLYPSVDIDLITNAAPYLNIASHKTKKPIRMIHHGLADRSRNIEGMINTMGALKNQSQYTLDLMLVYNDQVYIAELKELASKVNHRAGFEQVRFVAPVNLQDIVRKINAYDIQIIMTPPLNFNNRFSLPNKFFEAIQARNAIAIGPITEMAKIVQKHNLGVVADSFAPAEMAARLDALTLSEIDTFKANSAKTAKLLNAEANAQRLVRIIKQVLQTQTPTAQVNRKPIVSEAFSNVSVQHPNRNRRK